MSSSFLYVIELESDSLNFQVLLNDVPVCQPQDSRPVTSQRNVNQWIVEGTNRIEVKLALRSGAAGKSSFQLRLFGGEHGRVPEPKDALIEFIWDAAAQPLGEQLTTVFSKEFRPERSFGRWR